MRKHQEKQVMFLKQHQEDSRDGGPIAGAVVAEQHALSIGTARGHKP